MRGEVNRVWGIVLAAGCGRRFGGSKLLAPLEGRPLAAHVLAAVADACRAGPLAGAVVVTAGDPEVARLAAAQGLGLAVNDRAGDGLASSLRAGLAVVRRAAPDAAAVVVCLGDQPRTAAATIGALVAAWRSTRAPMVRPQYAETPDDPGHPVLLDAALFGAVEHLTGDQGLGPLAADCRRVPVPGRNPDVDTPADLLALTPPGP